MRDGVLDRVGKRLDNARADAKRWTAPVSSAHPIERIDDCGAVAESQELARRLPQSPSMLA